MSEWRPRWWRRRACAGHQCCQQEANPWHRHAQRPEQCLDCQAPTTIAIPDALDGVRRQQDVQPPDHRPRHWLRYRVRRGVVFRQW